MTKEEKYLVLRDRLRNVPCPHDKLNKLKNYFRDKIDSERRYDRIMDLKSLITILEKRDTISCNNVSCLEFVAEVLQSYELLDLINNLNVDDTQEEPIEENVAPPIDQVQRNVPLVENNDGRVLPRTDPDPINRVYDLICMDIGQRWKDFARALGVPEGYIDQLEYQHRNRISEMVREIITYHRENCDSRYWRYELSNGLIKARRMDLSQEVGRIFAMYNVM